MGYLEAIKNVFKEYLMIQKKAHCLKHFLNKGLKFIFSGILY